MRPATALLITVVVSTGFGCGGHPESVVSDVPSATTTRPVQDDWNTQASTSVPVTTAVVPANETIAATSDCCILRILRSTLVVLP